LCLGKWTHHALIDRQKHALKRGCV
jgi:hypothetical protein